MMLDLKPRVQSISPEITQRKAAGTSHGYVMSSGKYLKCMNINDQNSSCFEPGSELNQRRGYFFVGQKIQGVMTTNNIVLLFRAE